MRGFNVVKAIGEFYPKTPKAPRSVHIIYSRGRRTTLQTQPFGHKLFRGIALAHDRFLTRTVMVENNDVEASMRILNRFLSKEGLLDLMRRSKYYEKPHEQRDRMCWEFSRGVYQEDMKRKVQMILRKNRADAFPGLV